MDGLVELLVVILSLNPGLGACYWLPSGTSWRFFCIQLGQENRDTRAAMSSLILS